MGDKKSDQATRAVSLVLQFQPVISTEEVQARVYTRWLNAKLSQCTPEVVIKDFSSDLKSGRMLLLLIEVLTGKKQLPERGNMEFHHRSNVEKAMEFFRKDGVRLADISSRDIVAGSIKTTLILLEAVVMRYQVKDTGVKRHEVREVVFQWARHSCLGYEGVRVANFSTSFADGLALCAIFHHHRPDLLEFSSAQQLPDKKRVDLVVETADRELGIPAIVTSEDICISNPDDKIVFMYVASLFNTLPHDQHVDLTTPDSDKTSLTHFKLRSGSRTPSKSPERQLRSPNERAALSLIMGPRRQRSESPMCDGVGRLFAEAGSVRRSDSADTVVLNRGRPSSVKVRTGSVKVQFSSVARGSPVETLSPSKTPQSPCKPVRIWRSPVRQPKSPQSPTKSIKSPLSPKSPLNPKSPPGAVSPVESVRKDLSSLVGWLNDLEQQMKVGVPTQSTQVAECRKFYAEHQDVLKTLYEREGEVTNLLDRGNTLVKSRHCSDDLDKMQTEVVDLRQKWANMTNLAKEKSRTVSRTVISAQERQLQSLEMWLNQVEIALEKWDSETEDWQRNYLKTVDTGVETYQPLVSDSYLLVDMSAVTRKMFSDRIDKAKKRWETVDRLLNMKKMKLDRKGDLYSVCMEKYQSFVGELLQWEALVQKTADGNVDKDELESFRQLKASVHSQLQALSSDGQSYVKMHSGSECAITIQQQMDDVTSRWDIVCKRLEHGLIGISYGMEQVHELQGRLDELNSWKKGVMTVHLSVLPSFSSHEQVEHELKEIKKLLSDISSRRPVIEALDRAAHQLASQHGASKSPKSVTRDERDADRLVMAVDEFKTGWGQLCEGINQRNQELERVQVNFQRFTSLAGDLNKWMDEAELVMLVPSDPSQDAEREHQLKSLKAAQRFHINLLDNVEHLCGEILNQSSDAREVQTTRDSIKERWDDIDVLLRERLAVFIPASKESDSIMEQLSNIAEWLNETEPQIVALVADKSEQQDGLHLDVQTRLQKVKTWTTDASQLKQKVASISVSGLILLPTPAQALIKQQLDEAKERLADIFDVLAEHERHLEVSKKQIKEFEQQLDDLTGWTEASRKVLRGGKLKSDEESKAKLHAIEMEVEPKKEQVKRLSVATAGVTVQYLPQHAHSLERKLDAELKEFNHVILWLAATWKEVEVGDVDVEQTRKEIDDLVEWLLQLQKKIDVVAEKQGIEEQFQQCQAFLEELIAQKPKLSDMQRHVESVLSLSLPNAEESQQMDAECQVVSDKYQEMYIALEGERDRLQATMSFAKSLMDFQDWLSEAEVTLDGIAESPLGYGVTAGVVLEKCHKFQEDLKGQKRLVEHTNAASRATFSAADLDFVDACRQKLNELNSRHSSLCENVALLSQRLCEVSAFESRLEEFEAWLGTTEADVSAKQMTKEEHGQVLSDAADQGDTLDGVEKLLGALEENIEDDSATAYRERVEGLRHRFSVLLSVLRGDTATLAEADLVESTKCRHISFVEPLVTDANPSAGRQQAQYDSSAMEDAVAAMDKEKIKTLKKFERALVDLARVMDMADVEFRGISSTSMSVDDMLAKCEHLQQNLQKQETPITELKQLASTLVSFCKETGHSQAAEVIADRLKEQTNHYDELKTGTDAEHARLSQAADFAQSILLLAEWVMETDGVLAGVEKMRIGCGTPIDQALEKCKNLEQSLEQYRHTIEQVNESGEKVIPNLDPEVADVFQNKLQELNQQYRRLCSRTDRLSEMFEEVQSFDAKLSHLTTWCDQMSQQISGNTQPVTATKALQSEILAKNAEFERMPPECKDITDQLSAEECAVLEERTEMLMRNYELLREDAAKAVEVAEIDVESFTEECQKLSTWLKDVKKFLHPKTEDVAELVPIGDELEKCRTLGGELSDEEMTINHLAKSSKRLREGGCEKKQLDEAQKKYSQLVKLYAEVKSSGPQREKFLEKAVVFERDTESMMSWLSQMLTWLENCKKTKMQQEQREQTISMLRSNIGQQHPNCQSLMSSGESLVVKAEFARVTFYGDKLSMLKEKWTRLEEETNLFETSSTTEAAEEEEMKKQQVFSSAEDLVEWLVSTLDELKKQPPAAADLDVLKKQIDDHMELQENIADRQRDIEDNKASLTALVDESDVGEEAASLVTRLSEYQKQLSENSKCREQDLEKAMEASKTFHNDVNGVLAWLEDVESRLEVSPRDVQVPSGDEAPGPREMCKVVREEIDQKYTVIQDLNSRMSHLVSASGSQGAARLIQRIEELNHRYNEAAEKSKEYLKGTEYRTLNKGQLMREMAGLKDWLQTIEKWLMMQRTLTVDGGSEDQQAAELELERCTNLLKDLSSRRMSVESIVDSAHAISSSSDHNDEEAAMLAQEADYLQKFFEDVKQRCAERQLELQAFIQQELEELTPEPIQLETLQDVVAAVDDLKAWLDDVHSWLETQHPGQAIGEDISAIEKMLDLLKKCHSDLSLKQMTLNAISAATQNLTASQTPGSQVDTVVSAVASVSQSFGAVEQEVIAKIGVLERAAEVAGELQGAIVAFVTWLDETDALLDAQGKPAGDLEVLAQQLDKHRKVHSEVSSHHNDLNHIVRVSRPLLKTISGGGGGDSGSSSSSHNSSDEEESASEGSDDERDMSDLQVTIRELKLRYRDIGDKVAERQRSLEVAMQRLRDLCTTMQDLQFWMLKVDQALMEKVEENNIEQLQTQKESHWQLVSEFEVKHEDYRRLNDSCALFLSDCMDVSSASLTKDLAVLNRQWSTAESKMRLRQSQLEVADLKMGRTWVDGNSQARSEFAAACLTVYSWLGPLEEQLLKPVMLHADLSVIQEQCESYKAIQEQVAEHHHEIDQLNDLGDQAVHESASDSARAIEQDIEQVMERWEVICSLAPERLKEMESIQKQVQTFYSDVESLGLYLALMEETVKDFQLGDGIEEQLADPLEEFNEHAKLHQEVNEMATQLEEVSGGTSAVAMLKVQMMKLNDAWTTVDERLVDLQEKILQRQEFDASLSEFGTWIEDAENVVDREDPPQDDRASVDEELRALQELVEEFDTRAGQFETLVKISLNLNSCWSNYHSADSLSHLSELEESYAALRSRATAKHTRVASMRSRGQNWRETMSKLLVLLKKAEQLVETPVHHGCELATVQNQLISQKNIYREVLTSQADIAMVNETANEFQRPQLESMNRRWEAMRHGLSDRRMDLETANAQLEEFYSDVRNLHQMMVELEKRIRAASLIGEEEQLVVKMNECGSLLDKTDTTGHLLVDSSPTGSPAANTLQKALGQLTLCHNNLKELLQRWRSDPAGVSGKSTSLLITDNLGPLVNIIDSPSPQKSQLVLIDEPECALRPKPKLENLAGVLGVADADLGIGPPPASDIDGLQEQLERFKNHCIELNRYKMVLHSVVTSPDQSASPLSTRKGDLLSTQLEQRYHFTCSAVEQRHEELASMHSSISRVHTHLQELDQWIHDAEEALAKQRASGSISRMTQRMRTQFPSIQRRFETLIETVGRLCVRSEVEVPTDRKLRERVNTLGVEVDRIKRKVEGKRTSQLVTISPSAVTAFESDASRLLGWLDLIEVHVKTVSRDTMHEDSDVKDKQQQLQDIQRSLEDRRSHLDDMKGNLERLIANGDEASIQVITIQKAWDSVQSRWAQVSNLVSLRLSSSEKRAPPPDRLQNFLTMVEGMENWLNKMLSHVEPESFDSPDGKEDKASLSELEGLKHQMTAEEAHIDSVMREGNHLIELYSPGVPEAVEVARVVQSVDQRWRHGVVSLDKQINELRSSFPGEPVATKEVRAVVHAPRPFSAVDSPVHFVVYADELMAWLDDLESCLTASLVVGEAQSITDCLNKIKAMESELESRTWQYDHVIEGGNRQLAEYGETCSEVATVRSKKDQMSSRWDSVTTLLGHRKAALQTLLQEWQDFSCRKEGWNERVQLVVGRLAAQVWDVTVQPVPAVKKQRQVVEVLSTELDEHLKALKEIATAGQKLVSQSPKENTQPLSDWMRSAEMEWEELSDTVSKRPAELQELEKQWQTYLDGVTAFETWLHGMEVKVRDLEPVSSDPEQQQRQLEEQKILQDELNEQEPALGGINAAGSHMVEESKLLVSTASLEARIAQMNKRWETLRNSIEERRGDLGDPHVKRSRLLRQMADLLGWLSEVRKRVDYMLSHPLGGDFETVSVQVQLHTGPNGLKSQLDEKRPDVERMLADSKELQNGGEVVSQSDRALLNSISQVQEELRRTWTELMTKSDNWNKQLGKAYEELKLFEDTCNDLQSRLKRFEKGMEDEGPVSNDPRILRRQSLETEKRRSEITTMDEQLKVIGDSMTRQQQMGIDVPEAATQRVDKLKSQVKKDRIQGTNRIEAVDRAVRIINAMPEFPVPKLPDGWVRAETETGVPYFVHHNEGAEELQWVHPEMSELFAAFDTGNKHSASRTAMKLRSIVRKCCLDRVYLVHIVESTEAYGLAEQNDSPMDVIEMGNVLSAVYQAMPDVERMDVDVNKCTDMLLTWMVKLYDPSHTGKVPVLGFKVCLTSLCQGTLEDKYRYIFRLLSDVYGHGEAPKLKEFIGYANALPASVGESVGFPTSGNDVEKAVSECFKIAGVRTLLRQSSFVSWMMTEPSVLRWIPCLHRLICSASNGQTSRHKSHKEDESKSCRIS